MEKARSDLSKNEWILMKICWKNGKCTAKQVHEKAIQQKSWEYQTVKTMLDRLVKKEYLAREKFGPVYVYEASVSRKKIMYEAIENFIHTTLDDTVMPVFTHFMKEKKFTEQEISSIKKMIEDYEEPKNDE